MTSPENPTPPRPAPRPHPVPEAGSDNVRPTPSPVPLSSIGDGVVEPAPPRPTTPSQNLNELIAKITAKTWPVYHHSNWTWRGQPVTEVRLALQIHELIHRLLTRIDNNPNTDHAEGTGGLTVIYDPIGQSIEVTVSTGTIWLEDLHPTPTTDVADPMERADV